MDGYTVMDFAFSADSMGVTATCHHCGVVSWASWGRSGSVHSTKRMNNPETGGVAKRNAWEMVLHEDGCALKRASYEASQRSVRK